jgi:hypothetical protein
MEAAGFSETLGNIPIRQGVISFISIAVRTTNFASNNLLINIYP